MVQDELERFLSIFKDNIGMDIPFSIPKDCADILLDSIPFNSRDGLFFGYPQTA